MLDRRLILCAMGALFAGSACSVGSGGARRDAGTGSPGDDAFVATGVDTGTTSPTPDAGSLGTDTCNNGLDDTGDGLVDEGCTCFVTEWQYCWPGPPERRGIGACRDGIQQCEAYSPEFSSWGTCDGAVLPTAEIPNDGIDQDCDGWDDGSSTTCGEFEECGPNGVDEDCNGLVDCADPACATMPACSSSCYPSEFSCSDGVDDDCDGTPDCVDTDCSADPACMEPPPPPPGCMRMFPFVTEVLCGDGRDNDCDTRVDCDDPDCLRPGTCGCASTESQCTNGTDDDCDHSADCADTDCQTCTPGAQRWCDDPMYCHWGRQTCGSDGHWGTCIEVTEHAGDCTGVYYSASCCVDSGACCENYPVDHTSIGNCGGISTCVGG